MELVVNFSGGKDSCAMLAYLCETYPDAPKHVVFADTGWEHKDAIEWSEKIVARFGLTLHVVRNPNKDFLGMVRHRGKFPAPAQRQCTSDLKRGPIQTWIRRNCKERVVINCMGLRAEESPARAKKEPASINQTLTNRKRTVFDWLPIHAWSEAQVRSYLADRGIPLHPVYQYLNRFSCRICIYHSRRDLQAVAQHDPEAFELIANLEQEIGFTMQPGRTIRQTIELED